MRGVRKCSVAGCDRVHRARGVCATHYSRMKRAETTKDSELTRPPEQRFLAGLERRGGCLIWTGSRSGDGYGKIRVNGRAISTHRYAWILANGPIGPGVMIDHKNHCDIRCCEVTHLRESSNANNTANRSGPNAGRKHDLPRGVYRNGNGYAASVYCRGRRHHCGTFATPEEASRAASAMRQHLFGEFAGRA